MGKVIQTAEKVGAVGLGVGSMFCGVGEVAGLTGAAAVAVDLAGGTAMGWASHKLNQASKNKSDNKDKAKDKDQSKSSAKTDGSHDKSVQKASTPDKSSKLDGVKHVATGVAAAGATGLVAHSLMNRRGKSLTPMLGKFSRDYQHLQKTQDKTYQETLQRAGVTPPTAEKSAAQQASL